MENKQKCVCVRPGEIAQSDPNTLTFISAPQLC